MDQPEVGRGGNARAEVVVLTGLQGSGKTTFFKRYFSGTHVHVSKDLLRHHRDKSRRQHELIQEALEAGKSVVVDNTNARRSDRAELIRQARDHGAKAICYWLDAPLQDCLRRNEQRQGRERVPVVGILATRKRFEAPSSDEGFDELYRVRLDDQTGCFEITPLETEPTGDDSHRP